MLSEATRLFAYLGSCCDQLRATRISRLSSRSLALRCFPRRANAHLAQMSSQVETAADRLQALGAFDKSAVDAAELSGQEIARVLVRLGLGAPELAVKLTNGACAANYRCVLRD